MFFPFADETQTEWGAFHGYGHGFNSLWSRRTTSQGTRVGCGLFWVLLQSG